MDKYEKFKIKDYRYWGIYIHENQGYLGRCVIWCKRKRAEDLAQATAKEREELFGIIKELRAAVTESFGADWFNYSFLGNDKRHLHGHFIPRYATARRFGGVTFRDERWGHNYRTDHAFHVPDELVDKIREKIKAAVG